MRVTEGPPPSFTCRQSRKRTCCYIAHPPTSTISHTICLRSASVTGLQEQLLQYSIAYFYRTMASMRREPTTPNCLDRVGACFVFSSICPIRSPSLIQPSSSSALITPSQPLAPHPLDVFIYTRLRRVAMRLFSSRLLRLLCSIDRHCLIDSIFNRNYCTHESNCTCTLRKGRGAGGCAPFTHTYTRWINFCRPTKHQHLCRHLRF